MPTPEILRSVGDNFAAHGIRPHFDIGDISAFHGLGGVNHGEWQDDYTSTEADQYFIGNGVGSNLTALARGGEIIKEVGCSATDPDCHFPAYPGTVFWKRGTDRVA